MADLIGIGKRKKNTRKSVSETPERILPPANPERLVLSNAANTEIRTRMSQKDEVFRVGVRAGGCSGLEYNFVLDATEKERDRVIQESPFRVISDPKSFEVLKGCILDHVEKDGARRFLVVNPQAQSTCSCGQSFAL